MGEAKRRKETGTAAKSKQQLLDQYQVIVHLARAVDLVHKETTEIWATTDVSSTMTDMRRKRSIAFMERLGDMLKAMDPVDSPVFSLPRTRGRNRD